MDINSLIIGIISGIVSSIIIYFLVFQVKPKIKISDKISHSIEDNEDDIYRIKILNKSYFAVFNLNYSLHHCYKQPDGIIHITEIKPLKSQLHFISPKHFPPFIKNDKDENNHAIRLSYKINKEDYVLDENSYLQFTIIATHSLTNTTSYTEAKFTQEQIIDGVFETGDSLKVISVKNVLRTPALPK